MIRVKSRKEARHRRHLRVRKKVNGTPDRPRLCVCFTGRHIYAQLIDDTAGRTLASVMTTEKELAEQPLRPNQASAAVVGRILAERALAKNIRQVVFDRGGYRYHGKVKALADAARAAGLVF
ncbi:50S ribosomal protein L18 [Candidatus Methylacidithermus pantelleriae]|nr:50S ribosomal protein L18 [Candidatus Methylacidithermus pantelleriae]